MLGGNGGIAVFIAELAVRFSEHCCQFRAHAHARPRSWLGSGVMNRGCGRVLWGCLTPLFIGRLVVVSSPTHTGDLSHEV